MEEVGSGALVFSGRQRVHPSVQEIVLHWVQPCILPPHLRCLQEDRELTPFNNQPQSVGT